MWQSASCFYALCAVRGHRQGEYARDKASLRPPFLLWLNEMSAQVLTRVC
jgi:hypothetical protein